VAGTHPVKNLAGGGFTFEDRVGAWLAVAMLSGAMPLDPTLGVPISVGFQVDADGWRLDDLLIAFEGARCCGSVKSFVQVGDGRAAKEFVKRAGEDILDTSGAGFDREVDLVAMVTAPLELGARGDLQELIRLAKAQDPAELADRVGVKGYVSASRKVLWDSFARPTELCESDDDIGSPGELLARLRLIEADFEFSPSRALEQALYWCGRALADPNEAADLWDALLAIVSEIRPAGGTITHELLVAQLGDRFELRDQPNYERDWQTLRELSAANVEQIPDRLAGELHVDRASLRRELEDAVTERFVAVVGPSGSGKSALVKGWAAAGGVGETVLLRAEELARLARPDGGLRHTLPDTLGAAGGRVWLIVDGLDRTFGENVDTALSAVLSTAAREAAPVHVMITAQQQEWGALGRRLAARNATVGWRLVVAPAFTSEELATVLAAYPGLRDVVFRGRLTGVLETPKVLDTILTAMRTGTVDQTAPLTGEESAFARWFFDHLVCGAGGGRAARGALIMRLAERQGDRLQAQTPLIELDPAGLEHLDPLERDGVCVMQDGRVRFAHDLFGDWVRQQLILAQVDDRAGYVQARLTSPLWHRATRLHALALLATENPDAWREEMDRLGGRELGLLHDLFLEAPLFASDPGPVLETLWPGLVEADGRLLRRLLSRFLHIATFPHPGMVEAVSGIAEELSTEVAATQRVPYWPLWVPVLGLMSTHADEALALVGDEVARITDLWLRWTPNGFPLRQEAATLAIGRARAFLASAPPYGAEAEAARAWRAMLAAVREHRDDVIEISAALTPPREADPTGRSDPGSGVRVRTRIDEPFRETCLDGDALYPVITADPELAGELMFAVLEPRPPTVGWGLPGDEIGIGRMPNWFTPLYTRGPFLLFLRTAPTHALAFIRRLVEAATDRWIEAHTEGTSARVEVTLADGTTIGLRGDEAMMQWYRGDTQVPSPLACALMALEKWLYDEADVGHDIASAVAELLAGTTSIAMAGLLVAIGCRHPELLSGPLQPMLGAPDLYLWDTRAKLRPPSHLRIGLLLRSEVTMPAKLSD
jgi:hypothetical protein